MTTIEAKEKISRELIDSFREYLKDWDEMPDSEFGKKYGWGKGSSRPQYSFETLKGFMDDIFGGRWLPDWVSEGYPREVIWELHHDKWLSLQEYSNYRARMTGRTSFYYISQRTAREIWKQYK